MKKAGTARWHGLLPDWGFPWLAGMQAVIWMSIFKAPGTPLNRQFRAALILDSCQISDKPCMRIFTHGMRMPMKKNFGVRFWEKLNL